MKLSLDPNVGRLFETMERLEKYYYEGPGLFEGPFRVPRIFSRQELLQKQAPHYTGTAGLWQAIYGRRVWAQLNYETNAFAILGKKPWDRSGWRVKTAKQATTGGGIAEDGTIPTTAKATYLPVSTKPKIHIGKPWEASELLDLLSQVDDAVDIIAVGREDAGLTHRDLINKNLLTDVTTLAGNNIDSIDRVVSSYGEVHNCGDVHAEDSDIYGLDRDAAASWADAQVLHNSNVDRVLSLTLIDQLFRSIGAAAGVLPHVVLTGWDTFFSWAALLQSQNRYFGNSYVQPTYEGVRAVTPGVEGGFAVSTYFDRPIIVSKDVVQDTISRLYMLNMDELFLKIARPTRYFETSDPFVLNVMATRGLYETVGELICTFFAAQGKIRDLK